MPFILKQYYPARNVFFFLGEGFLIFLTVNTVYYLFRGPHLYSEVAFLYGMRALLVTMIFQLSFYFFDLYDLSGKVAAAEVLARIMQAFGVGCIVLAFVYYFFPIIMISSRVFWTGYGAICASIFLWRFVYNKALDRKMFVQPVVVLGAGALATRIFTEIEGKRDSGYKIVSFIGSKKNPASPIPEHIPVVAEMEQLPRLCQKHKVEKVVVALDDARGKTPVQELLQCKMQGISIENGVTFYEGLTGKIMVEKVNPSWLIYSSGFQLSRWSTFIKRFLDIALSFAGLLVSLPVTLISAVIIKLESPGPVFYKQDRVGEKGKVFNVIKFRSMRSDAEKNGPVWAMENDTRVTRYGGFIRKVRIDEIPQMWNVLKGEMSFVGPRPERPVFVEQLTRTIPYYALRHSVKPGITGWAQICYPYGASEEDALRKLEYDLYYIKNLSLQMDLWIIFQTIKTVLSQKGAR